MREPEAAPGVAWSEFYLAHRRQLTAYALALTGGVSDAEDLLHDVLLRMLAERRPIINALGYVLRSLRNLALDRRKAGTTAHPARRPLLEHGAVVFFDRSAAADPELVERVQAALQKLPEAYREVIVLKLYCALPFREVAAVLDLPQGTAASHYRRGLAELQTHLAGVIENV